MKAQVFKFIKIYSNVINCIRFELDSLLLVCVRLFVVFFFCIPVVLDSSDNEQTARGRRNYAHFDDRQFKTPMSQNSDFTFIISDAFLDNTKYPILWTINVKNSLHLFRSGKQRIIHCSWKRRPPRTAEAEGEQKKTNK